MSQSQLGQLISMVNQIAANNTYKANDEQAATKVANHLQRFWAPSMKQQLVQYAEQDGAELSAVAKLAVGRLVV